MASDSIWSDISDDEFGSIGSFSSLSDDGIVVIQQQPKSQNKPKMKAEPKIIVPNQLQQNNATTKKEKTNESTSKNQKISSSKSTNKEKIEDPTIKKSSQENILQTIQLQTLKTKIELNRDNDDVVEIIPDRKKDTDNINWKNSAPIKQGNNAKLSPTSTAVQLPEPSTPKTNRQKISINIEEEEQQPAAVKEQIILKTESVTPIIVPLSSPMTESAKGKRLLSFPSMRVSPINDDNTVSVFPEASPKLSPKRSSTTVVPVKTTITTTTPQPPENNNNNNNKMIVSDFPSSKLPRVLLQDTSRQTSMATAALSSSVLIEPERSVRSMDSSSNTVESHQPVVAATTAKANTNIIQPRISGSGSNLPLPSPSSSSSDGVVTGFCRNIKVTSHLNAIRFVTNGKVPKLLCASSDSTIQIYNLQGEALESLQGHTDRVISLAISNPFYTIDRNNTNEKILKVLAVSGSRDEHIRLWNLETGQCLHSIHAHKSPIWSVSVIVRSNSEIIIISTGLDGTMKSWDGKTGKRLCNFKGHTDKILSVFIYNPIGDHPVLFSGGGDKVIKAWDLLTGSHIRLFEGHEAEIHCIIAEGFTGFPSLVPVGITNTNGTNGTSSGVSNQQYIGEQNKTLILISASNDLSIRVWEFITGSLLFELIGHSSNIYEISLVRAPEPPPKQTDHLIPRNTPLIISCSDDGNIKLWNITNGKLIKSFKWHKVITRSLDTTILPMSLYTALHALPSSSTTTTKINNIPAEYTTIRQETIIGSVGWDKTIQLHSLTEAIYGNGLNKSSCTIS